MTGLRMNVADLLRRPGSTREVHLEVPRQGHFEKIGRAHV